MKRLFAVMVLGCGWVGLSGCELLSPQSVTVELINDGSFPVQVQIFIHDDQNVLNDLIDDVGSELTFTVPAGQTVRFTRDCDALQAIKIEDADLQVVVGIGPSAEADVRRDGTDFGCGDTLRFRFTHPLLPTRLDISFDAVSNALTLGL